MVGDGRGPVPVGVYGILRSLLSPSSSTALDTLAVVGSSLFFQMNRSLSRKRRAKSTRRVIALEIR
jgi:hypothetical protein